MGCYLCQIKYSPLIKISPVINFQISNYLENDYLNNLFTLLSKEKFISEMQKNILIGKH